MMMMMMMMIIIIIISKTFLHVMTAYKGGLGVALVNAVMKLWVHKMPGIS